MNLNSYLKKNPDKEKKSWLPSAALLLLVISGLLFCQRSSMAVIKHIIEPASPSEAASPKKEGSDFIKWVDFNVTAQAMNQAFRYDVDTLQASVHLNWVDLLARGVAGTFPNFSPS